MCVMMHIWGIRQTKFAGDFRRKIWIFDHLIKSILTYRVKIWGWKKYETIGGRGRGVI